MVFILPFELVTAESCMNYALFAGLELELVPPTESCDGKTAFLKVHAPWQVLTKFAESNSLRMPVIENEIELGKCVVV